MKSKPEYVLWSEAIVTNQSINARNIAISTDTFCKRQNVLNSGALFIPPYRDLFEESLKFCQNLNGEMPWPRNEEQLNDIISFSQEKWNSSKCKNGFWLPVKRSQDSTSKWFHETSKEEVTFGDWQRQSSDDISERKECMFFNTVTREYTSALCNR